MKVNMKEYLPFELIDLVHERTQWGPPQILEAYRLGQRSIDPNATLNQKGHPGDAIVKNLVLLVKQLCYRARRLKGNSEDVDLVKRAVTYLHANGLVSVMDILREGTQ